jgi:gas vesicle structural protein
MAVERVSGGSSLIDVLDRVLDKGIVIDAWARISLVGIDLITAEARIVVASIDTYLKYADVVGFNGQVSRPTLGEGEAEGEEGELVEVSPRTPRKPRRRR